ncbi:hypothetical protein GF342_01400 [Candidatus Woesearchaeota archaeon]|nr:hypothetical protein [Candidatus Woesearchaeota archaeon]
MLRDKRGLQVTVGMVVVLIIAILTLTVVIGFIKIVGEGAIGIIEKNLNDIEEQFTKDFLDSGKTFAFRKSWSSEEVAPGTDLGFIYAISNNEVNPNDPEVGVCYFVSVRCVSFNNGECTSNQESDVYVMGRDRTDPNRELVAQADNWASRFDFDGKLNVRTNDFRSGKVFFSAPEVPGGYNLQFFVESGRAGGDPAECDRATDYSSVPLRAADFTIFVG